MVYAHQIVDIIVSLQQTLFFVGRNFEKFFSPVAVKVTVCRSRSILTVVEGADRTTWNSFARNDSLTCTGSNPLFRALLRKISAKKLDTTTRNP